MAVLHKEQLVYRWHHCVGFQRENVHPCPLDTLTNPPLWNGQRKANKYRYRYWYRSIQCSSIQIQMKILIQILRYRRWFDAKITKPPILYIATNCSLLYNFFSYFWHTYVAITLWTSYLFPSTCSFFTIFSLKIANIIGPCFVHQNSCTSHLPSLPYQNNQHVTHTVVLVPLVIITSRIFSLILT